MKRTLLAAAFATLILSGCAQFYLAFGIATNQTPVVAVGNQVITAVNPEPIVFKKGPGEVTITWNLGLASTYRFAPNGIVIDGELIKEGKPVPQTEIVQCNPNRDLTQFSCVNKNTRRGTYKYTVRLVNAEGKPLPAFDPSIVNAW
jgi:hypothetical protein